MAGQVTPESIVVPDKMLQGMGVTVMHDEVTGVDKDAKLVFTSQGSQLRYDKLFLATGSSSFTLPIEGNELSGVLTLRGFSDALGIKEYLDTMVVKAVVFVGAGFISMEMAALF